MKINSVKIAGTAILLAFTIVLSIVSNFIEIAGVSINLSAIPIVLAGILYGPIAGLFLGFINGVVILFAPSTQLFFNISLFGTIIICLAKTSIAGLLSSYFSKIIKKNNIAIIVASLTVPIINTSLFILGALIFYNKEFKELISIFTLINFSIELITTIIFVPIIIKIINIKKMKD